MIETTFIQTLLTNPKNISFAQTHIDPAYLDDTRSTKLFQAICKLQIDNVDISPISLSKSLKTNGKGLLASEIDLYFNPKTSLPSILEICQAIKEDYIARQKQILGQMLTLGRVPETEALRFLQELRELREFDESDESLQSLVASRITDFETRLKATRSGNRIPGKMYSGINEIDRFSTMWAGKSIGIAGRPGMGKSSFLRTLAYQFAKSGQPVLIFSLEMDPSQIADAFLSLIGKVNGMKIMEGTCNDQEEREVKKAAEEFSKLPITIKGISTLETIQSDIQEWVKTREGKAGAVFIDYVQQIETKRRFGTNDLQMKAISKALMTYCKRYRYCCLPLFQLNRSVETRGGDKRPYPSDLRESGSFEQDLNALLLLYRPEYYGFEQTDEGESTEGIVEVIIGKNRSGPTGTVLMRAKLEYGLFFGMNDSPFLDPAPSMPKINLPNPNDKQQNDWNSFLPKNQEGEAPF